MAAAQPIGAGLVAPGDVNIKDRDGKTALMRASEQGKKADVERLLSQYGYGIYVNEQNSNGVTALIYASQNGHEEVVKLLLANGADVNIQNNNEQTALMYASYYNNENVVKLLLANGADMNTKDSNGVTALVIASQNGHEKVVKLLLDKGAKDGKTELMRNSEYGDIQNVERLIDGGSDVNEFSSIKGITALMYASENGRTDVVKLLLEKGADVNMKNKLNKTALMYASENGHTDVVKLLLEKDFLSHYDYGKHLSLILSRQKPIVYPSFDVRTITVHQIKRESDASPDLLYQYVTQRKNGISRFVNSNKKYMRILAHDYDPKNTKDVKELEKLQDASKQYNVVSLYTNNRNKSVSMSDESTFQINRRLFNSLHWTKQMYEDPEYTKLFVIPSKFEKIPPLS